MNEIALDAMDVDILNCLQKDASLSNQDLAQKVHTSAPTCLRRIKRLREAGLIGQVLYLEAEAAGF
jgi:DNA-binding Lrp family transcriptional regulator